MEVKINWPSKRNRVIKQMDIEDPKQYGRNYTPVTQGSREYASRFFPEKLDPKDNQPK